MALQVDLERRLAAAEERERELERQVEEGRRETEDVRNMMRLLVADEETREREAVVQREQQAAELVRPSMSVHAPCRPRLVADRAHRTASQSKAQRSIHELRSSLSSSEAHAGALSSQVANLNVELSRAQSSFEAELAELARQLEASDDDAQSAREKCERAEGERESMRRRLGELTDELESRRRDEGEREGAAVMREELKRVSFAVDCDVSRCMSADERLALLPVEQVNPPSCLRKMRSSLS
jgi:chromosome segregation ATPase